jgi:hypothetical protein
MSLTTFSDIPRSVLALLLDRVGEARGMSPRLIMGKPDTLGRQQIAELYAGGFIELPDKPTISLTPQFVSVARVLLNPRTNVTFRVWGNNNICGETNIQFPGNIMQGGGVILNQLGRMYRISYFVDDSTLVKMLGEAIPEPKEQNLQFEFKAHLDNTVAAILFAVIDLARIRVSKANKPEPILNMIFSTQEVYSYMYDRWTLTGFKDLITYITAVGIMPEAPSLTDTVDGLRVLAKAGILKEIRTDSYGITKVIEPLVRLTVGQPSGVQWQRVSLLNDGDQLVSNRMFIFGDKSFMLCIAPTVKGRLYIARVRRQEITDFLAEEVMATLTPIGQEAAGPQAAPSVAAPKAPPAAAAPRVTPRAAQPVPPPAATPPRPAAAPAAPPATCAQCGATLRPNAKHCSKCGALVVTEKAVPATASCPNCGASLKLGAKFCNKCGTVITGQQTQSSLTMCPKCGRQLKPGVKFCANCGTQI